MLKELINKILEEIGLESLFNEDEGNNKTDDISRQSNDNAAKTE